MASNKEVSSSMIPFSYKPIRSYQTRLLQLHGHDGDADARPVGTLHTVDLLDYSIEGVGLRSANGERDDLVNYDALSYTWGSEENSKEIICDGEPLRVTNNLLNALLALRHPGHEHRYLWIDAVCIDQQNNEEKAVQVRNMLLIYKKAARVVAWLGRAHKNTADLLSLATCPDTALTLDELYAAIEDLYRRPWFRRIWIQQEIFAARTLIFQWGPHQFLWFPPLSNPKLLGNGRPSLTVDTNMTEDMNKRISIVGQSNQDQQTVTSRLRSLHNGHLSCFNYFSQSKVARLELVSTLLQTGELEATNPRNHIYAVLGMTGCPAKPVSTREWMGARQHESDAFIPIDYSADLISILSTATWVMLMTEYSIPLMYVLTQCTSSAGPSRDSLPSWVVDWQVAARTLQRSSYYAAKIRLWSYIGSAALPPHPALTPGKLTALHEQFYEDNKASTLPCTKLVLRDIIDVRYYVEGNRVNKDAVTVGIDICNPGVHIFSTDLVVYLPAFALERHHTEDGDHFRARVEGPWLLRPMGNSEFRLVAYLNVGLEWDLRFSPYELKPASDGYDTRKRRRTEKHDYKPPLDDCDLLNLPKFIIIWP